MNASQFEARLKEIVHKLQAEYGNCDQYPTKGDVVEEILLGILGRDTSEAKAQDALERLRRSMVDYNEMRVAAASDVTDEVGPSFPDIEYKAYDLVAALSRIYAQLETLDLTEFKTKPKREADKWLSEVPGIDSYTQGRVMLLCFGAHSVPVNRSALGWLQHYGLFEDSVDVPEAQGVLERHVRSSDSMKVFCLLQRLAEKTPPTPAKPKVEPPKKKAKAPEGKPAGKAVEAPKAAEGKPAGKLAEPKARDAKLLKVPEPKATTKAAKPAAKSSKPAGKPAKKGRA